MSHCASPSRGVSPRSFQADTARLGFVNVALPSWEVTNTQTQETVGAAHPTRMSTIAVRTLSTSGRDFIDEPRFEQLLAGKTPPGRVRDVIAKSLAKEPLDVEETAALVAADEPEQVEAIFDAARRLKRDVYGNRIVLFAPLYVGNECVNDCLYCAFRRSNRRAERRTLSPEDLTREVTALEQKGHKRLILVFGEHARYGPEFIAQCVRQVYSVRSGRGEIRRVNINAAPLDHAGFATVKAAGIGTYQIFQETYHHETYHQVHPKNTRKGDYLWRLDGVARAMEAGCDDVGIGALFGLYDWRFEVLGLVAHARHLQEQYNVGPHTISFPRLRPACGVKLGETWLVGDEQFKRLVAILRLSVPYTGLICTAREPAAVRREVMAFGVSQIDAGSRIELGGYTEVGDAQVTEREQFELGDIRSLDTVMRELITDGYIPSFCTACYRLGRTGEHFMEFAIPGFIQNMCTPNALSTLAEYLVDYASRETYEAGMKLIEREVGRLPEGQRKQDLVDRLRRIRETDERDLYF
jgi:2-iminoacetate synthase